MLKQVFALILAWLAIVPAAADEAQMVMFDWKYFTDLGNVVNVEGSPVGGGCQSQYHPLGTLVLEDPPSWTKATEQADESKPGR
jgi:hypothetical protein